MNIEITKIEIDQGYIYPRMKTGTTEKHLNVHFTIKEFQALEITGVYHTYSFDINNLNLEAIKQAITELLRS